MSATALRWSAVPIGLLAYALRLTVTFWLQPFTWRFGHGSGLLLMVGGGIAAVTVPFGIFALLSSRDRRRPAHFAADAGRFTVPPSPSYAGSQAIMWMFLSGGLVMTERVPDGDAMRMADIGFAWPASFILVGVFWAGAMAFLMVQRPQLHLGVDGLTIRRVWSSTQLAWDDLAPGGPLPPAKRRQRQMKIYRNATPVFGRYPSSEDIPIGWLHIDPAFLAAAIRHYVEHPQDRAAIGTAQERSRAHSAAAPTQPEPGVHESSPV